MLAHALDHQEHAQQRGDDTGDLFGSFSPRLTDPGTSRKPSCDAINACTRDRDYHRHHESGVPPG
jgi:hypothetical protein